MDLAEVDFMEGGKPDNSEKNVRSKGDTNYNNSTYMSFKLFWVYRGYTQVVTHTVITPSDRA